MDPTACLKSESPEFKNLDEPRAMESESVIAFRADPMTHCLSARPRMGAPGEYSLEHGLSQNPPRLRSRESILGHPGPDTAGSLVKGASCRR